MGFYKILLQIVWHHLSSCNENKAFDNLLASSNCMSFLRKLAECADLDFGGGGVGGVQTPPPLPRLCKIGSSLDFHCKVIPGQTQKTVGPFPWNFFSGSMQELEH